MCSPPANRDAGRRKREHAAGPTEPIGDDDRTQLERARKSKTGAKFISLYDVGDFENLGFSHSEADLSLCSILRFWLGRDAARIDAAFRRSALMRPKWDRADYRDRTLEQALIGEVYSQKHTNGKQTTSGKATNKTAARRSRGSGIEPDPAALAKIILQA